MKSKIKSPSRIKTPWYKFPELSFFAALFVITFLYNLLQQEIISGSVLVVLIITLSLSLLKVFHSLPSQFCILVLVILFLSIQLFSAFSLEKENSQLLHEWNNSDVVLAGEVRHIIKKSKSRVQYLFIAKEVWERGESTPLSRPFGILISSSQEVEPYSKTTLQLSIKNPPRFDGFDYAAYLKSKNIFALGEVVSVNSSSPISTPTAIIFRFKITILEHLQFAIPQKYAGILVGLLFGIDTELDDEVEEVFKRTGLMHIVVASGYNIVLLVNMLKRYTAILGRNLTYLATILVISFYVLFVGVENIPIVRAGIFGIIMISAASIGRKRASLYVFMYVATAMLVFNPRLWNDISFQLSFATTFGLMVWVSPLEILLTRRLPSLLSSFVKKIEAIPSILSTCVTFPIIAANFGAFSVLGVVVNIISMPIFSILTGFGAILAVAVGVFHGGLVTQLLVRGYVDLFQVVFYMLSGASRIGWVEFREGDLWYLVFIPVILVGLLIYRYAENI